MTIDEMVYDFKLKADKVDTLSKQDFLVPQIDWFLNQAHEVYLKRYYGFQNPYRDGFEMSQKRVADLAVLHMKYPVQPAVALIPQDLNIYELPLDNLLYTPFVITRVQVELIDEDLCKTVASTKLAQNDDLNDILKDPFNNSTSNTVPINFGKSSGSGASIFFYPGTKTLGNAFVEYLKMPIKVWSGGYEYIDGVIYPKTNSEMPEHTHQDIVSTAVELAKLSVEDPSYQAHYNFSHTME